MSDLKLGDEVVRRNPSRFVYSTGKIIGIVPGGYEVKLNGKNAIVYENDETIELRYADDNPDTHGTCHMG